MGPGSAETASQRQNSASHGDDESVDEENVHPQPHISGNSHLRASGLARVGVRYERARPSHTLDVEMRLHQIARDVKINDASKPQPSATIVFDDRQFLKLRRLRNGTHNDGALLKSMAKRTGGAQVDPADEDAHLDVLAVGRCAIAGP